MTDRTTAFVFPGQGPQQPEMLSSIQERPGFAERYDLLCAVVGTDVLSSVEREGPAFLNRNEIASTVTVLCSVLERERLRDLGVTCRFAAGYSVGQWTAMHAAGMLSFEATLKAVHRRAVLMNESPATEDGAMLAVIGLPTDKVAEVADRIAAEGDFVTISNYNCLGQLSLAGTKRGIARAKEAIEPLRPRKLVPVDVAGAWHCALLGSARDAFRKVLDEIELGTPSIPIADNVTGEFLPTDPVSLRDRLADHISSPVRWEDCVLTLAGEGVDEFIEVGYGDMLTKFGFFIDRRRRHVPSKRVT